MRLAARNTGDRWCVLVYREVTECSHLVDNLEYLPA